MGDYGFRKTKGTRMKKKSENIIGNAMAGHAFRITDHKKAKEYDNPLTDYVNLIIAETKAKQNQRGNNENL